MRNRVRASLLFFLTAGVLLQVPAGCEEPRLFVAPGSPRQGEALFVRVTDDDAQSAEARWRNGAYPLYREREAWAGVVPVNPDTPAGGCVLRVTLRGASGSRELTRRVEVARVSFPIQRLSMAPARAYLYNFPGARREDAAVSAALRTRGEERLWKGPWALPVKGRLSTPFGVRRIRNGRPVGRHRGLDLAAPEGTPVYAPAGGRVVLAARFKKYGHTVVLDHGFGITSLYIHMSARAVKQGQVVTRGARLGSVGMEGVATGPHLHWAVDVFGTAVQPLEFVRLAERGVTW